MCKGLRENSQAVHEFMFNVNVRINKLKREGTHDVVEVGGEFLTVVFLIMCYDVIYSFECQ